MEYGSKTGNTEQLGLAAAALGNNFSPAGGSSSRWLSAGNFRRWVEWVAEGRSSSKCRRLLSWEGRAVEGS